MTPRAKLQWRSKTPDFEPLNPLSMTAAFREITTSRFLRSCGSLAISKSQILCLMVPTQPQPAPGPTFPTRISTPIFAPRSDHSCCLLPRSKVRQHFLSCHSVLILTHTCHQPAIPRVNLPIKQCAHVIE